MNRGYLCLTSGADYDLAPPQTITHFSRRTSWRTYCHNPHVDDGHFLPQLACGQERKKAGIRRTSGHRWRLAISRPSAVGCCIALGCVRFGILCSGFVDSSASLGSASARGPGASSSTTGAKSPGHAALPKQIINPPVCALAPRVRRERPKVEGTGQQG